MNSKVDLSFKTFLSIELLQIFYLGWLGQSHIPRFGEKVSTGLVELFYEKMLKDIETSSQIFDKYGKKGRRVLKTC